MRRPGVLTFLLWTTLAPVFSWSLPPPSTPQALLATARQPLQMCTAGPWLPEAPVDRSRLETFTCPRACGGTGRATRAAESSQRGQGGVTGGWEGGLPSHASPQAGPVAKDEFVYSQETRLPASREKGFFYRGLEGLESKRAGQPKPQ